MTETIPPRPLFVALPPQQMEMAARINKMLRDSGEIEWVMAVDRLIENYPDDKSRAAALQEIIKQIKAKPKT